MSSEFPDTNLDSLLAEISRLTAETSEFDNEIIKVREAYLQQIDLLKAQRQEIKNQLAEKKDEFKKAERLKAEQDQLAARKNEIQILNEKLADLSHELDSLTNSAKWREFAYDHQIYAGKRIAFTHGFILADSMGLGKTLSSILALDMIAAKTANASYDNPIESGYPGSGLPIVTRHCGQRVLYLCPKSLLSNVKKEFTDWAPDRHVYPLMDSLTTRATKDLMLNSILPTQSEFTLIVNHESWRRDKKMLESLINLQFDTIVIDEAHRLKSVDSDAFETVMRLINHSQIPFRILMTGTPILNKPDDIWTALHIISPRYFRNRSDFLYAFCDQKYVPSGKGHRLIWTFRPGGEKALLAKIESLILRRTLTDVGIELPPVTIKEHVLTVDAEKYPEQYRAYVEMREYGAALAADGTQAVSASVIIAMLTRLRQLLHWPAGIKIQDPTTLSTVMSFDIQESQKLDYIIEPKETDDQPIQAEGLITEIARHKYNPEGQRIVCFSQFTSVLYEVKRRLVNAGYQVAMITGDTPDKVRREVQLDFDRRYLKENNLPGKFDIVLCNYRAGGVGLNLTDATSLVAIDSEWSPGMRNQAYARLHRIGQESPITVHEISVEGTVDDWMLSIMSAKQDILEGFETELDVRSAFREALENGLI